MIYLVLFSEQLHQLVPMDLDKLAIWMFFLPHSDPSTRLAQIIREPLGPLLLRVGLLCKLFHLIHWWCGEDFHQTFRCFSWSVIYMFILFCKLLYLALLCVTDKELDLCSMQHILVLLQSKRSRLLIHYGYILESYMCFVSSVHGKHQRIVLYFPFT